MPIAALLGGVRRVLALGVSKIEGRAEQADVRECLWEISNLPAQSMIILLREQTHVIPQLEQAIEDA